MAIFHARIKASKSKPNRSKAHLEAKAKHQRFLASMGISTSKKRSSSTVEFPDLTVDRKGATLSNAIPSNGFKRSIDDYKWRRDREETQAAIVEAERKKSRVAPAYNKGPVMYVTDADEPSSLGRKV